MTQFKTFQLNSQYFYAMPADAADHWSPQPHHPSVRTTREEAIEWATKNEARLGEANGRIGWK
jgi:hypothetical protein